MEERQSARHVFHPSFGVDIGPKGRGVQRQIVPALADGGDGEGTSAYREKWRTGIVELTSSSTMRQASKISRRTSGGRIEIGL